MQPLADERGSVLTLEPNAARGRSSPIRAGGANPAQPALERDSSSGKASRSACHAAGRGREVEIEVSDQGTGIEPDDLARISMSLCSLPVPQRRRTRKGRDSGCRSHAAGKAPRRNA